MWQLSITLIIRNRKLMKVVFRYLRRKYTSSLVLHRKKLESTAKNYKNIQKVCFIHTHTHTHTHTPRAFKDLKNIMLSDISQTENADGQRLDLGW